MHRCLVFLLPTAQNRRLFNTQLFNDKLREWEDFYNYNRPHAALGGQTPYERLREKMKLCV